MVKKTHNYSPPISILEYVKLSRYIIKLKTKIQKTINLILKTIYSKYEYYVNFLG